MDKMIDNPWFLRSTALFFAVILFFVVQAGEEKTNGAVGDSSDYIQDIPVTVYYDSENLIVSGVPETVNMRVEGPPNLVQTIKLLKDFTLRVDLRSLPTGEHTVEIQAENISDKLQVRIDPATVDVVIEEKITQSFRVDPELNERLLAENFTLEKLEVTPRTIEVTGAKSVIDSISFVTASVDAEQGLNKSFEQKARVRVLDKDLNKLNVTIVPEQVNVEVGIAEYSKEIPIVLKKQGIPAPGVTIEGVSTNDKMITVSGQRKLIDEMKEFVIDVDISKVNGEEIMDIDLKKPKGITKMSLDKVKVKVEATASTTTTTTEEDMEVVVPEEPAVETEKIVSKEMNDIMVSVKGLDEKYKCSFVQPASGSVNLTATAEEKLMVALEKKDFTVYVDASNITDEGEQTLPFTVVGPTGVKWKLSVGEVTVHIELA